MSFVSGDAVIVYRKAESTATTHGCMNRVLALLRRFDKGSFCHGDAVEVLIEWGEFASGVIDAVCPQEDTRNNLTRALDEAGVIAGHIFRSSWEKVERGEGDNKAPMKWASGLKGAIHGLFRLDLPGDITLREPEGFAHYGLYPETYLEAARRFFDENRPKRAACIGLRSIGVSLSAVVAAVLEDKGCAVSPFTLRPREHPFNRRVILSGVLASELPGTRADYYLIVDEGPGLSGTSLSSAADSLSSLGIPDDRIVLFPSWEPDGANFFSESARRRWQRHKKYTGSFEDIWVRSGRLAGPDRPAPVDVSAGFWRGRFFEDSSGYPAVDPYHEKRKYLFDGGSGGQGLLRFAGLGRYGRIKLSRAGKLSGAGFIQKVHGLKDGFLDVGFEQGRPVTKGSIRPELLDRMGEYLAFIKNQLPARKDMAFDELYGMAERNTLLGLGQEWAKRLNLLEGFRKLVEDSPPSEVDGRMLPHEWIDTGHGYIKADGFDHFSDQFFPCAQDIAWDMAGAMAEFGLDRHCSDRLMERYISLTGDRDVKARLSFFSIAYLAYRLGYCTFAEREMRHTPDGPRFKALLEGYGLMLKREILKLSA